MVTEPVRDDLSEETTEAVVVMEGSFKEKIFFANGELCCWRVQTKPLLHGEGYIVHDVTPV